MTDNAVLRRPGRVTVYSQDISRELPFIEYVVDDDARRLFEGKPGAINVLGTDLASL